MYKLILVDDHLVIQEGIQAYFKNSSIFSLEGVASNVEELFQMISKVKPDVILMDIDLNKSDMFDVLKKMKEEFPEIKKVVFTYHEEKSAFLKSVEAGISGYILKSGPYEMISPLLISIMEGGFVVSPKMHRYLVSHSKFTTGYDSLTAREKEVLPNIAKGYSNSEIAQKFALSVRTIEFHKNNIKEKLNLRTLAEIIQYYSNLGK